jgi:hypothetical protein
MDARRADLLDLLEQHYRSHGWPVTRGDDATLSAKGPGGVTWLGTALVAEDFDDARLEARILDLAERRMPGGGELCPLDLLPGSDCEPSLRGLLAQLGLSGRPHVSVYAAGV